MKMLSLFLIPFSINTNVSNEPSITLESHYKVESTFSGNTSFNESFHIILAKNTESKQFELIPATYQKGELKQLPSVKFDKEPSISSFHNSGKYLSLIVSAEGEANRNFTIIDINLETGESTRSTSFSAKDHKAVIRKNKENIILYSNEEAMKIIKITNAKTIDSTHVILGEDYKDYLKALDSETLQAVNTNEFVANGSINSFKVYAQDESIYITKDDIKVGETSILEVPLNQGTEVAPTYKKYVTKDKRKKLSTYIEDQKLFQLNLDKDKGDLHIIDLKDNDRTKTLDLFKTKPSTASSGFTEMSVFLKKAIKTSNEPTITVNKTNSGNLAVRIDYVYKKRYTYQYDWWWHHQFMFHMWQHQQHIRATMPTSFGPSEPQDDWFESIDEHYHFELLINSNMDIVEQDNYETIYKDIDKKKHIDLVEDNTNLKNSSTVFLENDFRYFGFDKRTKSFKVFTKEL